MNKFLLGAAFLGLSLVSCQNLSKNTVEPVSTPKAAALNIEGKQAACSAKAKVAKSECASKAVAKKAECASKSAAKKAECASKSAAKKAECDSKASKSDWQLGDEGTKECAKKAAATETN